MGGVGGRNKHPLQDLVSQVANPGACVPGLLSWREGLRLSEKRAAAQPVREGVSFQFGVP